jgi:hypothetical protein
VFVNTHECEYREPAVRDRYEFSPPVAFKSELGDAKLIIKVAKIALEEEAQGIAVLSHGVWYESTLAGSERKEQANYIFGEIDVPSLADAGDADIPAFDLSRRMKLNKSNPLVQKIHAFVGMCVEEVRAKLVEEEQARRKSAQAQALKREASKIAEIINKDFAAFKDKLQSQQAKLTGSVDKKTATLRSNAGEDGLLAEGGDITAALDHLSGGVHKGETDTYVDGEGEGGTRKRKGSALIPKQDGDINAKRAKGRAAPHTGGFDVDFNNAGKEAQRASYEAASRTIWINLNHPQFEAALTTSGIEGLAYEVAFAEYAIELVHELNASNFYIDVQDAIYDVRETLDRVSRAAAALYS